MASKWCKWCIVPCVVLYTNSEVAVPGCYLIIAATRILETFWENIRGGIDYIWEMNACSFTNIALHHRCVPGNFPIFSGELNLVCHKRKRSSFFCNFLSFIFFFYDIFFSLRKLKHFFGNFCNLLLQSFLNFQPRVGWLLCEFNQKWPKTKSVISTLSIYETPW